MGDDALPRRAAAAAPVAEAAAADVARGVELAARQAAAVQRWRRGGGKRACAMGARRQVRVQAERRCAKAARQGGGGGRSLLRGSLTATWARPRVEGKARARRVENRAFIFSGVRPAALARPVHILRLSLLFWMDVGLL